MSDPRRTTQPKHFAISQRLEQQILSGQHPPGSRLKSEPELALEFGVAAMTIRRALESLAEKGLVYKVRGRGTYACIPPSGSSRPALGLLLRPDWHILDPFYFPPIISGFIQHAEEQGFQAHIASRTDSVREMERFRELGLRGVAVVMLTKKDMEDADALLNQGTVVVAINHYGGLRRVTSVFPDNRKGMASLARTLMDLGHKRLVYFNGPPHNLDARERRRGFEQAVRERQGQGIQAQCLEVGFLEEHGYGKTDLLLRKGPLPTAILTGSDVAALGALKRLHEAGVSIPGDVSVTGFGDFRLANYFHPSLTTARMPLVEMGQRAAEALIAQIKGGRLETVRLECPIIWRASAGPPPA